MKCCEHRQHPCCTDSGVAEEKIEQLNRLFFQDMKSGYHYALVDILRELAARKETK